MDLLRPRLHIATVLRFTAICGLFLALFRGIGVQFGSGDGELEAVLYPLVMAVCCALTFMGPRAVAVRCRACGRKVPASWLKAREDVCPACRSGRFHPAQRRRREALGFAILAFLILLLAMLFTWVLAETNLAGRSWLASVAVSLGLFVGLFLLLVVSMVGRYLLAAWRMASPGHALEVARTCAREPGRITQHGTVSICSFGSCDIEAIFQAQKDTARERFESLVGEPVDLERPLRVFGFGTRENFDAFFRRAFLYSAGLSGS